MGPHPVFAALADPTRFQVLTRLAQTGPATATELSADLPVSRQAIVKHLYALDAAGLVERTRVGREVRYSFEPGPLGELVRWIEQVGGAWDSRLDQLRRKFE